MAQPIPCDICGETTADLVVTVIADGQVIGVGVECLLDWALPIAEAYAQAVAREAGDRGTVNVAALDPPDMDVSGPAEAPQEAQEGPEGSDADWEALARPAVPRGRKRGAATSGGPVREDTETSPAAHVDR
jgi:hypothetical protein